MEWLAGIERRKIRTVGIVAILGLIALAALASYRPVTPLDPIVLARQRTAAEHSIARGYEKAAKQVRDVRGFTLAIPQAEADQIAGKALADLNGIRLASVTGLALATGATQAQADAYARQVAPTLQGNQWDREPGILLAPAIFAVVVRTTDSLQQVADEATRQIARDPRASPRPSPSGR